MGMQIWPAIDLRGGKCVRLEQGDYARETVFDEDPVRVAVRFQEQGSQHLHLVDLDGARDQGFRTAFVRRPTEYGPAQTTDLEPGPHVDLAVESIVELADALLGTDASGSG